MASLQNDLRTLRRQDIPQTSPPYAPQTASLGGVPEIVPDIPVTAVFLFFYTIFAIVHMRIMRSNQKRGHKFIFSGALFGFCKIRVITMSLRIAWACHNKNIGLGIAATIFVYVGTVILYFINWFFAQRIVRAQHPRWGWSMAYRAFHRAGMVFLIVALLFLIVASIQQFFTLDAKTLRIDRDLQLTGTTYFAAFCLTPILLVLGSLMVSRKSIDKFGAGRLRNNIFIFLLAATILLLGQTFRCVTSWLPPVRIQPAGNQPFQLPWYLSRACFYCFNFSTELIVVVFYALVRVDLRFHVPDGANGSGAYSKGRTPSSYHINVIGKESNLRRIAAMPLTKLRCVNISNETIHEYESSLFEDTRTLADSLRYPSSVLEVDQATGHYKVRRASSIHSGQTSHGSEPSLWSPDRETYVGEDPPPLPPLPADWPLRTGRPHARDNSYLGRNGEHTRQESVQSFSSQDHNVNGDAIAAAMTRLEANSEINRKRNEKLRKDNSPGYADAGKIVRNRSQGDLPMKRVHTRRSDVRKKHLYSPDPVATSSVPDLPRKYYYGQQANRATSQYLKRPLASDGRSIDEELEARMEFARFSDEPLPFKDDKRYAQGKHTSG